MRAVVEVDFDRIRTSIGVLLGALSDVRGEVAAFDRAGLAS
jgi:hypothetical protein